MTKAAKMAKDKKELMNSAEFNDAILAGAELKKTSTARFKTQNKATFERFYETLLNANPEIKKILDTRRKNRTDSDKEALRKFKGDVGKTYRLVCEYLTPEAVEDGRMTKIQKLVDKVASALDVLRYIQGISILDTEFDKRGISLATGLRLEDKYEIFKDDKVKENIIDIFNSAVSLKQRTKDDNTEITEGIYAEKIPVELQFDKELNNSGLKPGDFRKLVDLKAKQLTATTEGAKAKIAQKLHAAATDKQFEIARAELMRDKINGKIHENDEAPTTAVGKAEQFVYQLHKLYESGEVVDLLPSIKEYLDVACKVLQENGSDKLKLGKQL